MRRFEGKVAIVTGGSNGIGATTARKFMAEGAYVYIADIDEERGVKVCQELHGNASFVKCDVAIETHVKGVIDRAMEEKGCLDIMVNNVGIVTKMIEDDTGYAGENLHPYIRVGRVYFGFKTTVRID
ncbi:hypothetical protein SUGI_0592690 [Cryptomeria japonica]|uniref:zerumbone synthase-like n=1 Tax=Cryptomeria japonica TaxID=3369 RepID=UPI0024148F23|nr:zerumbone synthase-like [Cryptomeria japonica]GLJ29978.1 hypothetical protein SUGI_0592690 [Cryptomeria japonica]